MYEANHEKKFNDYFETVYSIAAEYYPKKADVVTIEIFNKKIFPKVDNGILEQQKDEMAFIVKTAISYCVNRRFEEIYDHYFLLVYGIAERYHFINPDDATQQVFEKKVLPAIKRKKFVGDDDYAKLIATIARRVCNTIYNRKKRRQSASLEESEYSFSVSELIDPSVKIDLMIDLGRALEQLSRRQCLIMVMTIEGYGDDEIAKELGCSVSAIRQARYRARQKLKKILS